MKTLLDAFSKEKLLFTCKRFPITIGLCILPLIVYNLYFIFDLLGTFDSLEDLLEFITHKIPDHIIEEMLFIVPLLYTIVLIADIILALWTETFKNRKIGKLVHYIGISVAFIYCILINFFEWYNYTSMWICNCAIIVSLLLYIPFVKYNKSDNDIKSWNYLYELSKVIGKTFIISIVISILLGILVGVTTWLLGLESRWLYINIYLLIYFLIAFYFLHTIPNGEYDNIETLNISKISNTIIKKIIFPFMMGYIAIMYIYALKILFQWELPDGGLSYLLSFVMVLYIISYTLLYPQIRVSHKWHNLMRRIVPTSILPLLLLMTIGVFRRLSDYGITYPRLYLITLLGWFYFVTIIILISKETRFRWIYISAVLVILLSSVQPFNYYNISKYILVHQYKKELKQNNIKYPLTKKQYGKTISELDEETQERLSEKKEYLYNTYDDKTIDEWLYITPN